MQDLPQRKKIRLKNYDYSSNAAYFVTICVKDKHEMLGKIVRATVPGRPQIELSQTGKCVDNAINYINKNTKNISIAKYVIMPNHIHAIFLFYGETAGDRGRSPLQIIIRNIKSYITKQIGYSIWQKSFYDHIIRDEQEYLRVWQYIDENPAKWEEDKYYNNL